MTVERAGAEVITPERFSKPPTEGYGDAGHDAHDWKSEERQLPLLTPLD